MYVFCTEFLEVVGVSSTLDDFKIGVWDLSSKFNLFVQDLILSTIDNNFNGVWEEFMQGRSCGVSKYDVTIDNLMVIGD